MAATSTSSHSLTGGPSSALFPLLTRAASMTSDHPHPAAVTVTSGTTDNNSSSNSVPNSDSSSPSLRKVIIRKDERGFGLKVSGSHPVFVAQVTDGGPAARAGVRVGDRIIRVNGTNVNATDHNQVVHMIKGNGDILVALDLIPAPAVPLATSPTPAPAMSPGPDRPAVPQKPAIVAPGDESLPAAGNRSTSPLGAAVRRTASGITNYYRPGNHQPMIPIHLSESSGGAKRGLSLTISQPAPAGEQPVLQGLLQQTSPVSQTATTPSITSPVPAPMPALIECEKAKESIFKNFVIKEKEHLDQLVRSNTQGHLDEEVEKAQRNIQQWSVKLKEIRKKRRSRHKLLPKNIFSPSSSMTSSQTHLVGPEAARDPVTGSTDDLNAAGLHSNSSTHPVHLFWSRSSAAAVSSPQREGKESRKSHSFKDELLLKSKEQILSMESDDECDDDADEEDVDNEAETTDPRFSNLSSRRRPRKKSKEVPDVDEDLKDIEILIHKLIECKKRYLQTAGNSSATRSAKEKITGRRKGPSAVRSSFMSSSSTPEEVEWANESRKLLSLVSYSLNQRKDINYLLFFGLGCLVQLQLLEAQDDGCKKVKGTGETLFELISLFLVGESPLALKDISPTQGELDTLRNSADTSQDGDLLQRYLCVARESVNRTLIHSMNQTKLMGLLPSVTSLSSIPASSATSLKDKKKLKESMRKLLSDALSFEPANAFGSDFSQTSPQSSDFNLFPSSQVLVSHLKQLIQGAPLKGDATDAIPYSQSLARVVSLLSLFYHLLPHSIFFSSPPPELDTFVLLNALISSRPGSVGDTASAVPSGPRHKSLPSSLGTCTGPPSQISSAFGSKTSIESEITAQTRRTAGSAPLVAKKNSKSSISSAIGTYSHNHVMTNPAFSALRDILWCVSCGHLLWGKPMFSLNCMRCSLTCHSWCFFTSIQCNVSDFPCIPLDLTVTTSSVVPGLGMIGSPTTGLPLSGPPLGLPHNLASGKSEGGRRSFFAPDSSKFLFFKTNQSKLSSASDLGKTSQDNISNSTFYTHLTAFSSSSSLDLSSSSSSSDETSIDEDCTSAASDPSTPILGSTKHKRRSKNLKKTKRSKSLEEGVTSGSVESASECKSKEFEQALEEEEKDKRYEKEKRRKKLKQRKLKLSEMISTEKSFGNKLHLLEVRFYTPIVVAGNLLTREEIASIFSNHRQLIELHVCLYKQLKEKIKPILLCKRSRIDWKHVGDLIREIFLSVGQRLEEEMAYFCVKSMTSQELLKAKSKHYKFKSFLETAEDTPDLDRLKFKDLLAAPIQRIMRYPLLMKEVLSTFPNPSHLAAVDPIDSGKTDVRKQQLLATEMEGREAIEAALLDITRIVDGVNRRKKEFEFLSWFRHKIAPFYSKANSLTFDSIRLRREGAVNWSISRPTAVPSYLLLLQDLLVILTIDQPNTPSSLMPSSTSTSALAPPPPPSASTSPSTAGTSSSSSDFRFSFLSENLKALEAHTKSVYSLKIPSAAETDKQPGLTVNPVLEITPDLDFRFGATTRTAFFLFSKGFSSSSTVPGHKSKDVEAKAAMYELITPSEKEREDWTKQIRTLVDEKNTVTLRDSSSVPSVQRSISTNPFHWSHEQEQDQVSRNRNRPLPPLPVSASVTAGIAGQDRKKGIKMSSMKRSKSQDGSKSNLNDMQPPSDATDPPVSHSREPSDSDLPPIVGLIERMPAREPLNHFSDAVCVTGPPDVRYAQRITVKGQSHYANDVIWNSGDHLTDESHQAYEEVDTFDESRMQENMMNQQILALLEERKKLLSSKSTPAAQDLAGLALDAFRLEMLTLSSSRNQNNDRKENEMNELRVKLVQLLTK